MTTDITPESQYEVYRSNPSPQTLHGVVKSLAPTINYALSAVNSADDPVVRSKAELYAAQAVEKYQPEHAMGASLSTHVGHQLRQLSRTARTSRSPIRIPERVQLESYKMAQSKTRYMEEHGREPSMLELADYTGVPLKHLEKLNRFQLKIPSEAAFDGPVTEDMPDHAREAMEYIYHDADHIDRRIMELKMGFGGVKPMSPQEVATTLRLHPSQLSRRSMRLAAKIQEVHNALEHV